MLAAADLALLALGVGVLCVRVQGRLRGCLSSALTLPFSSGIAPPFGWGLPRGLPLTAWPRTRCPCHLLTGHSAFRLALLRGNATRQVGWDRTEKPPRRWVGTMCLAIPGQILEIVDEANRLAKVDVAGVRRNVNIGLLDADGDGVAPGDWVLIHVGFAISKVDEQEAVATRQMLEGMGADYEAELAELKASVIEDLRADGAGGLRPRRRLHHLGDTAIPMRVRASTATASCPLRRRVRAPGDRRDRPGHRRRGRRGARPRRHRDRRRGRGVPAP